MTTAPAFAAIGAYFLGGVAAGREQREVDTLEGVLGQFLYRDCLATKAELLARRARARQRFQPAHRELSLVKGSNEFGTDGTGHAGNGNDGIVRHFGLPQAIKKPRTFLRRSFGSDDAIAVLRAHDSRSTRGLAGFGHGFRGRHGSGNIWVGRSGVNRL
jgi:hypothetical protein